ncbi:MAG: hypothetical protein ABN482_08220 [Corticimicrobacter sp.]|uniref:hypothetical protein n=1 Tax=Corticimicrobacter sp. TaxID=2678536 RepID=UPI0032DB2985
MVPAGIIAFVEATITPQAFEQHLYQDTALETALSAENAPSYCHNGTTLFHYLIGLNYRHPGDVLNARHVLTEFLQRHAIPFNVHHEADEIFELLLDAQPVWLRADLTYLSSLLAAAPEQASGNKRRSWLKQQIVDKFRYVKRPPKWLQAPEWPISETGPLIFLGQLNIDEYFHDNTAVYLFLDPQTGTHQVVTQTA